ncbi:MAG: hypothetical protein IJS09_02740 [Treponema sp.]|nr:hypothetical protein [Treponema sp.]
MTNLNKKLLFLSAIMFLLCVISFLPFVSEKSAPKSFQSAFLNPSHRDEVTEIVIAEGEKSITLKKLMKSSIVSSFEKNSIWTVSDGQTTVRADEKQIQSLLTKFINIRKMYTILYRYTKGEKSPSSACSVLVSNDVRLYTKIDFFGTNSLTNRVSFSVEEKNSLFETADDVSQYLQTTISFWVRPELFQLIDKPISFVWQENGKKSVKIDENTSDFSQKLHNLTVVRHGSILSPTSAEQEYKDGQASDSVQHNSVIIGSVRAASLFVSDSENNAEVISFYPQSDGSYRCEYEVKNGTSTTSEFTAIPGLSFAFEISGWTYDRLRGIFEK